jgi:hypothetical protein
MESMNTGSRANISQTTKRQVLAQVFVCSGCCCGRTDKGNPQIPLEWLKTSWKDRKLLKAVQLTITGCLGPCDKVNVFSIATADGYRWFGGIRTNAPYEILLEWATTTLDLGKPAPIPDSLLVYEFLRFHEPSNYSSLTTIDTR